MYHPQKISIQVFVCVFLKSYQSKIKTNTIEKKKVPKIRKKLTKGGNSNKHMKRSTSKMKGMQINTIRYYLISM